MFPVNTNMYYGVLLSLSQRQPYSSSSSTLRYLICKVASLEFKNLRIIFLPPLTSAFVIYIRSRARIRQTCIASHGTLSIEFLDPSQWNGLPFTADYCWRPLLTHLPKRCPCEGCILYWSRKFAVQEPRNDPINMPGSTRENHRYSYTCYWWRLYEKCFLTKNL